MELLIRGTNIPEPVLPATILLPWPRADQQHLPGTQWAATPTFPATSPSVWSPAVGTKTCQCFPRNRKPHYCTHRAMARCLSVQGFAFSLAGSSLQATPPPSGHYVSLSLKFSKRKVCLAIWGERDSHLWQPSSFSGISGAAFSLWGMQPRVGQITGVPHVMAWFCLAQKQMSKENDNKVSP